MDAEPDGPRVCPKCKSPYWNRPPSREVAGQEGCVIGPELVVWACFKSVPGWICTSDLPFSRQALLLLSYGDGNGSVLGVREAAKFFLPPGSTRTYSAEASSPGNASTSRRSASTVTATVGLGSRAAALYLPYNVRMILVGPESLRQRRPHRIGRISGAQIDAPTLPLGDQLRRRPVHLGPLIEQHLHQPAGTRGDPRSTTAAATARRPRQRRAADSQRGPEGRHAIRSTSCMCSSLARRRRSLACSIGSLINPSISAPTTHRVVVWDISLAHFGTKVWITPAVSVDKGVNNSDVVCGSTAFLCNFRTCGATGGSDAKPGGVGWWQPASKILTMRHSSLLHWCAAVRRRLVDDRCRQ